MCKQESVYSKNENKDNIKDFYGQINLIDCFKDIFIKSGFVLDMKIIESDSDDNSDIGNQIQIHFTLYRKKSRVYAMVGSIYENIFYISYIKKYLSDSFKFPFPLLAILLAIVLIKYKFNGSELEVMAEGSEHMVKNIVYYVFIKN